MTQIHTSPQIPICMTLLPFMLFNKRDSLMQQLANRPRYHFICASRRHAPPVI